MSSFSSILSSIGGKPQAPQQSSSNQPKPSQPSYEIRKLSTATNGVKLAPSNAAAGVKRKSEEPESAPRPKMARSESESTAKKPLPSATSSRFQLSEKGATSSKPSGVQQSSTSRPSSSSGPQRPTQHTASKSGAKPGSTSSPTPPSTANGAPPAKRGFASIMERAKAAQDAAKTTASNSIKHKPVEKMNRKERLRMMEEAKLQQKSSKHKKQGPADRSRSVTPVAATTKPGPTETGYKGTMKKKAEPLAYKGTMRAVGPGGAKDKPKAKGQAQDKYGGYASWSDLDDAEEEEEDDYESDVSSDMEGGFDDVEQEENMALRAARLEDQRAQEEEDAHRKEKLARKMRLEELSKSAAAKKKY